MRGGRVSEYRMVINPARNKRGGTFFSPLSLSLCCLLISLKHFCSQLDELMTHATFQRSPITYPPLQLIVFEGLRVRQENAWFTP